MCLINEMTNMTKIVKNIEINNATINHQKPLHPRENPVKLAVTSADMNQTITKVCDDSSGKSI